MRETEAGHQCCLNSARGRAIGAGGDIYVADTFNYRLRRVLASSGVISTIGGTGNYSFNVYFNITTTDSFAAKKGRDDGSAKD
jgi:hypothetical protein